MTNHMTLNDPVRIAVVGTGSIGTRHMNVLSEVAGVTPIAVPRRPERADEWMSQGFLAAKNLEGAMDMGASMCIVATNTADHLEDGRKALDLGLDVLMEKPMTPNAQEAQLLNSHAMANGRSLHVGCVMRFGEGLERFRNALPEIGQLHWVRIEAQSYLPDWRPQRSYLETYSSRPVEGGVLLDLIHEVDYAGWIFGWPAAVQGRLKNTGRLGIFAEEIVELDWETAADCMVSVCLDYLSKPPHRFMRACGEDGTVELDGYAGTVWIKKDGLPVREIKSDQTRNDTFSAQARAFVRTADGGEDSRLASAKEGIKALAVCDAARRASNNRREEAVEYP